jgi:hypothetical protein
MNMTGSKLTKLYVFATLAARSHDLFEVFLVRILVKKAFLWFGWSNGFTPFKGLFLHFQTCLGRKQCSLDRLLDLKPVSSKYECWSWLKPSDEIFILPFNILLIYELSNVNLNEFLKFEYLHVTYNLAVKYMNSKHVSRLEMKYVWRCSTFSIIH